MAAAAHPLFESLPRRAEARSDSRNVTARTQLALVRALVDEVRRRSASDPQMSALLAQLDDEVDRLDQALNGQAIPPSSGVTIRA